MALIKSGAATDLLTVDTGKAAYTVPRPMDVNGGGYYRYANKTGTIAAALAASAVLFAFRWGDATKVAVITRLKVFMQGNVAFTAAAANLGLHAIIGRSYTASHTGGTAATLTGSNNKMRTSHATSLIATNGDLRIANTAGLGGGTVTFDQQAFTASPQGRPNVVNAAAGTEYLLSTQPGTIDFKAGAYEYPLVLAQNEGFCVRNSVVWPAAGTAEVSVEVAWAELPAF